MLLAAAICAASALMLAGCGASSTIDPVAQAATASTSAPGYRTNVSLQFSSSALSAPITATGTGAFDPRGHVGSLVLDMNLGNDPRITEALGGSTLHLAELVHGTTVYLRLPDAIRSKVPQFSKPWIKLDLAQAAAAAGIPGLSSLVNNPLSGDPSQVLQFLRASGNVSDVGTETVDGFRTTHYRATISLDRVADALPPGSRNAAKQAITQLEATTHVSQLPVDAWVDGQHRVRRMRISLTESVGGGQTLSVLFRLDIPEYGPQPVPAPPPDNQVLDIASLLAGRH